MKQLVELMGGSNGVKSTEGVGSTFWFTVPVHLAESAKGSSEMSEILETK